jgi:ABC-type lipoprotein release transport system permease subunit
MTALALRRGSSRDARGVSVWALAWRNLWRNPRRTWLTAGGIGFAVWLLVFGMSMQDGTLMVMVDNGARMLSGHVQLQHPAFQDDPRLEHLLSDGAALVRRAEATDHVTAALPRAEAFALASAGERSYGAQVLGVVPARERAASTLPGMVEQGRYLQGPGEAFLGTVLARNLRLSGGDEVVLLGTSREGGVAAPVADVVGTVATGQPALDRSLLQIDLDDFRAAWNLGGGAVHSVVLLLDRATAADDVVRALASADGVALGWQELMPEMQQTIEIKRVSMQLFFAVVTVIVAFSVVNTFMMTVFERTREFGMLMALGMRHVAIVRQLCMEALWLAALGVILGLVVSGVLVGVLARTGIPLPADAAEIMARYNMPGRMYPAFNQWSAVAAAAVMFVGTQLAVLVPALRVRRLQPVEALRAPE